MSAKPETRFYTNIHTHLKKMSPFVYSMKNNNPYVGGIPDCWYSGNADDMWIEYKWLATDPVRKVVKPMELLSDLQQTWIRDRHVEGRNVMVIIGCPSGGVMLPGITWEREFTSAEFMALVKSRKDLAGLIHRQVTRQAVQR